MAKKTEKSGKVEKYKKAPGIFKKPVKKIKWEKKFLKKVYLPEDIKFLKLLAVEEDGLIRVDVSGLSGKDFKRLKLIGKAIKANRKGLNFILIFILVILVGGGVFFQLYLKNNLVQRLIETQLEKVFLAEVDIEGANLSIFKGELSLDYLAISDAQSPMRNLIEFSRVEANMDTSALLKGRVYIEELGFSDLVRGGEREVSGALPSPEDAGVSEGSDNDSAANNSGAVGGKDTDGSKDIIGDVVGQISALAGDIDVEEILAQQKENLESFDVIDNSKDRLDEYAGRWESRAGEWEDKIGGWDSSIDYIGTVNSASFSSIEGAQSTIDRLQGIYSEAEHDYVEIQTDYSTAQQQYNDASAMMAEIRTAVEADYAYIESLVTLPTGEKVDWAASILEEQLSMPLKKYLSYLDRGLEWYGRFKKLSELNEEHTPEKRRNGRSLPDPGDTPPGFVLVHAFASGAEPGLDYRFDLNNLVSKPEQWPDAARLDIGIDTVATGAAKAVITEESLSLDLPSAPFDLESALSGLDINAFSGLLSVKSETGWNEDGFSGSIDLGAEELVLGAAKENSILFRLINTAVESVKPVTAVGDFIWSEADGLKMTLDTDLDEGLGNAALALISEGADEGLKILQDYLGEQLAGPMAEFESVRDEFEGYVEQIDSYQSELDSYKQKADAKIAEVRRSVEDNIKKEAEALIKAAVPDEVNKQIEGAADTLKKGLGDVLKF